MLVRSHCEDSQTALSSIRLEQETLYGRSSLSNKPSLHKSCHKSIIWLKSTNVERKDSIHFKAQSAAVHLSGLCCSVITTVFMNQCVHRCNLGDCNRARFRSLTWNNTEVNFQFKIRAEDRVWERVRQGIHFAVVQYWAPHVKRELFRRPERGGERQRWCLLRTLQIFYQPVCHWPGVKSHNEAWREDHSLFIWQH